MKRLDDEDCFGVGGLFEPTLNSDVTCLEKEVDFFESLLKDRLVSYSIGDGDLADQVLRILVSHTKENGRIRKSDSSDLREKVTWFIRNDEPVIITLSLAVGCRMPNPLKFRENIGLPTYAWLYLAFFFKMMHEKVCMVYDPGIRVVIFDEAMLFSEKAGISRENIVRQLTSFRSMISLLAAPVEVVEMRSDMFDAYGVSQVNVTVHESMVYAIVCSFPDMIVPEIAEPLYCDRNRDYVLLRQQIGEEMWGRAYDFAEYISRHLAWRKQVNLFSSFVGDTYLDACVTSKEGRLVYEITSNALLNHGMPVVRRVQGGEHKIYIVPEYRIGREFPEAIAMSIESSELSGDVSGTCVFYYLLP